MKFVKYLYEVGNAQWRFLESPSKDDPSLVVSEVPAKLVVKSTNSENSTIYFGKPLPVFD